MSADPRIPAYLGRVLSDGAPVGTCFQVTPGVLVTAWHVLDDLDRGAENDTVEIDALNGAIPITSARVLRVDPLHDLAVLRAEPPLPGSVGGWFATDRMRLNDPVAVTGVSEVDDPGHEVAYLDAPGHWAGGTTRDQQVRLGRLSAKDVMRGMSGAPVRRTYDDRVIGVVSARYNSADGWLEHSVWVARTEDLQNLLAGVVEVTVEAAPDLCEAVDPDADGSRVPSPMAGAPPLRGDEIARPQVAEALVAGLLARGAGSVGVTTGLVGAGGFGKTTLARIVTHDERVRSEFGDGLVWVTVGEDRTGPELAALITSAAKLFDPHAPEVTDPHTAGTLLGRALDGRRVLLVVDDVWSRAQVEPFLIGADRAVRLFTTRQRGILPHSAAQVVVDQMRHDEATTLLTTGLPTLPPALVEQTSRVSGRWPVLLALVHGALTDAVSAGGDGAGELAVVLEALRAEGITALDVDDPGQRDRAVGRTIEISLDRLAAEERDRYSELAVFGNDVRIPLDVVATLWGHTAGWTRYRSVRFCARLFALSLLAEYSRERDEIVLHDVIGAYLRGRTQDRRAALNNAIIDAHRDLVPPGGGWATLPPKHRYLWTWLCTHLDGAGLVDELEAVLTDAGWLVRKLELTGPAELETDLERSPSTTCRALATIVRQSAHLLGPLSPRGSLAATLASRLPPDAGLDRLREQLYGGLPGLHLRFVVPPPDLPNPALRRVIKAHSESVSHLVVAPDGTWLGSGGADGVVRIWDPGSSVALHVWDGPPGDNDRDRAVTALVVAPDGSWLASADSFGFDERTIRLWDPCTGQAIGAAAGDHPFDVRAFAAAADSTWLASADGGITPPGALRVRDIATGRSQTIRTGSVVALTTTPDGNLLVGGEPIWLWDPVADRVRRIFSGPTSTVWSIVVDPGGAWFATAEHDGSVRLWDLPGDGVGRVVGGHDAGAPHLVVPAKIGSWFASSGEDGVVRVWDPRTGEARHTLSGDTFAAGVLAADPHGTWLAAADGNDVWIWDPTTGQARSTLTDHADGIGALAAAPDGTWLASGDGSGDVRIWDLGIEHARDRSAGHRFGVGAVVIAPDGSWLASADESGSLNDGSVLIWDHGSGEVRHVLPDHELGVHKMAIAPDGSRLVSTDLRGTLRSWDPVTGEVCATLPGGRHNLGPVSFAPHGEWLAFGDGHEVKIWDTTTTQVRKILTGHTENVGVLCTAPDGSWLAAGGFHDSGGTVRIWDPITGQLRHTLAGHAGWMHLLAAAPHGAWLACGYYDGTLQIWDPATGRLLHTLTGQTGLLRALAIAPDGSWLATAGDDLDGPVQLRNTQDWQARRLIGHTGPVKALCASLGGAELVSAGTDGTVRVWDAITGRCHTALRVDCRLRHLAVHRSRITAAGDRGPYFMVQHDLSR